MVNTVFAQIDGFNPQPARRPAEAPSHAPLQCYRWGFNPQPARRPAEAQLGEEVAGVFDVSIRSRPEDRLKALMLLSVSPAPSVFQSAAGPKTG